jgi:hypothetical protein
MTPDRKLARQSAVRELERDFYDKLILDEAAWIGEVCRL